jgi:hypothetical protein
MTAFDSKDSDRLDWTLLEGAWVTLYRDLEALERDLGWLKNQGYAIHRFDCATWVTERDALAELGRSLGFKDCLDRDGGEECVCDIDVPVDGGAVVVLISCDRFQRIAPRAAQAILDVLALNARHFMLLGRRWITLAHSSDPELEFEPVGATRVKWRWTASDVGPPESP